MPANLTPEYLEAERRYREAKTPTEKLACLEEMLTVLPKHKGTDKLKADLRRKISKLKTAADDYINAKLDEIEQRLDRKLEEIDQRLAEWRDQEIAKPRQSDTIHLDLPAGKWICDASC